MTADRPDDIGNGELERQYPELARARNLFIELFKDQSPLINLGYTASQRSYVTPTLQLITDAGEVIGGNYKYIAFTHPDERRLEEVYISENTPTGFHLSADRDDTYALGIEFNLTPKQKMSLALSPKPNKVSIFRDIETQIADIHLLNNTVDVDNLDELVRIVYSDQSTDTFLGLVPENRVTNALKAVGLAGTYKAAWVDTETKHEFVLKVETKDIREWQLEPEYFVYRKLASVSDATGSFIPLGRKANTSGEQIEKILEAQGKAQVSGQLAYSTHR